MVRVTVCLSCIVFEFEIQQIICEKSQIFTAHVYLAPQWGDSIGISSSSLASEDYISWATSSVVCMVVYLAIFREHRLVTDRQTDTGL